MIEKTDQPIGAAAEGDGRLRDAYRLSHAPAIGEIHAHRQPAVTPRKEADENRGVTVLESNTLIQCAKKGPHRFGPQRLET